MFMEKIKKRENYIAPKQSVPSTNPQALWRRKKYGHSAPKGSCFTDNRLFRAITLWKHYVFQVFIMVRSGMTPLNILRFHFPIQIPVAKSPPSIDIEFTNVCNLACTYCNTTTDLRPKGLISRESLDRIVYEIMKNNIRRVYVVGNGEPTLHPDFVEFIQKLGKATGMLSLTSNFQKISEQTIEAILNAPVALLNISLDGVNRETYERHRVRGDFNRLLENLLLLREMKKSMNSKTFVNIRLMIHPSDERDIKSNKLFWKKYADNVSIQYVMDTKGIGGDVYDIDYTTDHYPICSLPFKRLQMLWDGSVPM